MAIETAVAGYAEGVLKSALGKIGSFLYSEAQLWFNVREDLQFIKDELHSMDAFMQDMLRSGPQNEQMKIWMIQVFEVACQSEECINKFIKLVGGDLNERSKIKKTYHAVKTAIPRYKIATTIQELKSRAKEVSERRSRYSASITTKENGLTEFGFEDTECCLIQYNHLIAENKLVGIGADTRAQLFNFAFRGDQRSILFISGPPGAGKTALAKMIYCRRNDPKYNISCSAWVTVSDNPKCNHVLENILRQVQKSTDISIEAGDTEKKLRSTLDGKRYLLVLDSCERKLWEDIKNALPHIGKVVLTTREDIEKNDNEERIFKVKELTWEQRSELISNLLSNGSGLNWLSNIRSWHIGNKLIKLWLAVSFNEDSCNILKFWLHYFQMFIKTLSRRVGLVGKRGTQVVQKVTFLPWQATFIILIVLRWHQELLKLVFSLRDEMLLRMNWQAAYWCIVLIFIGQYYVSVLGQRLLAAINSSRFLRKTVSLFFLQLWMVSKLSNPVALKCFSAVIASSSMNLEKLMKLFVESIKPLNLPSNERILEVMTFCCERMSQPSHKCFKDLKNLPEGYVIERKRLIRHWLAANLVKPSGGFSKEEEAERCFDELVSWSVIEPESVSPSGQIKSCRVNGAFKKFNLSNKAASRHSSTSLGSIQQAENTNLDHSRQEASRDQTNQENVNRPAPHAPSPSSVINSGRKPTKISSGYRNVDNDQEYVEKCIAVEENWVSLTIIDLEGCRYLSKVQMFDKNLCECTQLRFLSLRNTDVDHLPKNIGKLKLLQILIIRQTKVKKLPKGIWKLQQLETLDIRQTKIDELPNGHLPLSHLKHFLAGNSFKPERDWSVDDNDLSLSSAAIEVPDEIGDMSSLQTLAHVNSKKASKLLHAMPQLTNLKKLGIVLGKEKLNSRALCFSLMMLSAPLRSLSICDKSEGGKLNVLEYLSFPYQHLESLTLRVNLWRLPQWIASHRRLKKLTLSLTQLPKEAVSMIGKVPSLLCLRLYTNSLKAKDLALNKGEFPALKMLVLHCESVLTVQFNEGTAPRMEVFKWFLSKDKEPAATDHPVLHGISNLAMLNEILIAGHDITALHEQVKEHPNYGTTLFLNKDVNRYIISRFEPAQISK